MISPNTRPLFSVERERLYIVLTLMLAGLPKEERQVIMEARAERRRVAKRHRNATSRARKREGHQQ